MQKNKIKYGITIICLLMVLLLIPSTIVRATTITNPIENPEHYNPTGQGGESTQLAGIGKTIVATVQGVGIVISVIGLMFLGIRYMYGSMEERAKYKETMYPFIIGLILLLAVTSLLQVIYDMAMEITAGIP